MTAAIRAELVKLKRPKMLAGVMGLMIALSALATTLAVALTSDSAGSFNEKRPGAVNLSLTELAKANGATRGFLIGAGFAGVVVMVTFAVSFAGEFGNGTIRNLFLLDPRRMRVLGGKFLALLGFAAAGFAVAEVVSIGTAAIVAGIRGIPMHEWTSVEGVRTAVAAYGSVMVATIGWAVLGTFVALLFRSVAIALAVAVAWVFPFENILHNSWSGADKLFPGLLLQGIGVGTGGAVSWTQAVLTWTVYAAVFLGIAALTVVKRDVTA
jgi:ABC-2 type transport system permease protein